MATPDISVVVPTYRRSGLLPRLVAALEAQTLPPERFEVVIVDNASDDDTAIVLADLAARSPFVVRVPRIDVNRGPAAARNLGWRSASAPIVAFTDDDCVPDPGWLEAGLAAMAADEGIGVAQGRTVRPAGSRLGDWTVFREVLGPSPFFEGCNLFARRRALDDTEGFAEDLRMFGEDTDLGWAVLEAGHARGFADGAVVVHDVDDRGLAWRIRLGYKERRNLMAVAARRPAFRAEAFWRPWAFRREDAVTTLAVVGLVAALRWRPAALLALPYLRERRPHRDHPRLLAYALERFAVDTAHAAGVAAGALRNRIVVV